MHKRSLQRRILALVCIAALVMGLSPISLAAGGAVGAIAAEAPKGREALPTAVVPGREKLNFNQGWKFIRRNIKEAEEVDYPLELLERWESVDLPHTVRLEPYNTSGGVNYQGQAMYRKHFLVPEEYIGKKIYIEFEALMMVSDIWVNGVHTQTEIAAQTGENTYYGGYLPVILDITDLVHTGEEENVITVLVDNRDNINVPPGKPQGQLDFTYMGGIYRNAWLTVTDPVHITDANFENIVAGGGILVDYPAVSEQEATVDIKTHIRNEAAGEKRVTLTTEVVDKENKVVGTAATTETIAAGEAYSFAQSLTVKNPKLWNLDDPYMHTLRSTVTVDGVEVDRVETPIGIRKIDISLSTGLMLNGEKTGLLSGVNRHQEYPYIGFAASSALQRRDAVKFKSAGFNIVRMAHHPQSPDFLAACDELGIMVLVSVPGWQHWSGDPRFAARLESDIRSMIRRDRNHPSVLAFEISLNESWGIPSDFTNKMEAVAKQEHPSLKTAAENSHQGAVADIIYGIPTQVAGYSDTACALLREYGDHWIEQFGNFETVCRVTRGPGTFYPGGEAMMVEQANNAVWKRDVGFGGGEVTLATGQKMYEESEGSFIAMVKWIGIDHNRGYHETMSPCGPLDFLRLPKYMYYAYASQRALERDEYLENMSVETGPLLFIASSWSERAPAYDKYQCHGNAALGTDTERIIYVYSNAETVKLSVIGADGTQLWSQTNAPATRDDAEYLDHAPFEFTAVPYTAGSYLKAEGLDAGKEVIAQQEVHTALAPAKLRLEVDYEGIGLTADGSDAIMVYAYVLDENGTVVPTATNTLTFSAAGEGSIVGDGDKRVGSNPINAEAGITGVYIRATKTPGDIVVSVSAEGLEGASVTITSQPLTQKTVPYVEIAQGEPLETTSGYLTEKQEAVVGKYPRDYTKGLVTLDGTDYTNSITIRCMTGLEYELEGAYDRITGKIALKDPQKVKDGTVFKLYADGVLVYASEPVTTQTAAFDVNIGGAKRLVLETEDRNGVNTSDVIWLDPYLYEGKEKVDQSELRENLAFGKTAEATSCLDGYDPALAVDGLGEKNSRWNSAVAVAEGKPQALTVDLGSKTDVRNARVALLNDFFNYTYTISVSPDGINWVEKSTTTKTGHASEQLDLFAAENVRYLKIEFTQVATLQGHTPDQLLADVVEFEVYRDKGVDSVTEYNLKGLEVAGKNLVFTPGRTEYSFDLQGFENQLYVKAIPADRAAEVTINGVPFSTAGAEDLKDAAYTAVTLNADNQIVIAVEAANGKAGKIYTITANDGSARPGVYYASECSVPGINGANQWHYQAQAEGGPITDISDESALSVSGEQAWEAGDWFYCGPRFMHPGDGNGNNVVRTFTAPRAGEIILGIEAELYPDQSGSVTVGVWKNDVKIWPAGEELYILASGGQLSAAVKASVAEDDRLHIVVGPNGSNAGDAVCMISSASYSDAVSATQFEILGSAQLPDASGSTRYQLSAKTAEGIAIPEYPCKWSIKEEISGAAIDEQGRLTLTDAALTSVTVLALDAETSELLAWKRVTGHGSTAQPENLALNRPAAASTDNGEAAGKANDGDFASKWCEAGVPFDPWPSLTEGEHGVPQWWQVDLGETRTIGSIQMSIESKSGSNCKYYISMSDDPDTWTDADMIVDMRGGTDRGTLSHEVEGEGRYLRVTFTEASGGVWATIIEIAVYASAPQVENIALGKTATAGQAHSDAPAENAVDGDSTTLWYSGGAGPCWWQVDLGEERYVDEVSLVFGWDKPRSFLLRGSLDGENWTDIQRWPEGGGQSAEASAIIQVNRSAHYLKVDQLYVDDSNWVEIAEFSATTKATEAVSVESAMTGGTLRTSSAVAAAGDAVTVSPLPDQGYQLKAGSIRAYKTGDESTAVPVTGNLFIMPDYGVTVTAEFEKMSYCVTFKVGGKTVEDGIKTVRFGETLTTAQFPAVPEKIGHTGAWDVAGDIENVTENLVVRAFYTGREYAVSFDANGGEAMDNATVTVTYGQPYGSLPAATSATIDKIFDGWYTEAEGGDQVTDLTLVSASEDHTLYAHWRDLETSAAPDATVAGMPGKVTLPYSGKGIELSVAEEDTCTYQWEVEKGAKWVALTGEAKAVYTIPAEDITFANSGWRYHCIVTNSEGDKIPTTATGSAVTLTVEKGEKAAPDGLMGRAPSTLGGNDGQITGLDTGARYEYKRKADIALYSDDGFTIAAGNSSEITGLVAGAYLVRYTETDEYNTSLSTEVAVPEYLAVAVKGVELTPASVHLYSDTGSDKTQLTVTISPENADNKAVIWSSSNEAVATVDANGLVTIHSDGAAVITVTTVDGGLTATCAVTVSACYPSAGGSSNTTTKTEKNGDGSTTRTVTNKKTGAVIETTTYPDGTKIVASTPKDGETTIEVTVPKSKETVIVTIPTATEPKPGEVAVVVREDGTKEILKTSIATEDGMRMLLSESCKLEIVDNSRSFTDVASDHWAADAVQFAASRELFTGTGADAFSPAAGMTRGMLMTVLARLDGQDTMAGENWYTAGMEWAKEQGISDGSAPEAEITRESLAVMLYRYAGNPEIDESRRVKDAAPYGEFADVDSVSGWAGDAMLWAVESGIITGSDNKLNPGGAATRAEVAAMLMRFVTLTA